MRAEQPICFATFRLDPVNERLWRGAELLALRPRPFAVLRYLAAHPGRLVTKEELLEVLWPHTRVSPGVLKGYVRVLRQVLEDDAEAPRFIETVPGRGYRFIAPLTTTPPLRSSEFGVRGLEQSSVQHPQPPTPYTLHPPWLVEKQSLRDSTGGWKKL
jgi:DNA-binding winged helix-turn-helix (wHTH) protein